MLMPTFRIKGLPLAGSKSNCGLTVEVFRSWDGSLYAESNGPCGPACNVTELRIDGQWHDLLVADPEIRDEIRKS